MSIPESQLTTWSNQGATVTAKNTHEAVRRTLERHGGTLGLRDYEIYLQGSYKNSTNIFGDSDVDVVVQLNSTFRPDLSALPEPQKAEFHRIYPDASYTWTQFRAEVLTALRQGFGPLSVSEGNKSLKVIGNNNRLPCDVVPCLEYRRYSYFSDIKRDSYAPGIVFWTRTEGRTVINFPKPHYDNGVAKHSSTSKWFKPMVRVLKNARNTAINRGHLGGDAAPSYFLECFVYNAPDHLFGDAYQRSYFNIASWWQTADLSSLLCQNEQMALFGGLPGQWSEVSAKELVNGLAELWDNWY